MTMPSKTEHRIAHQISSLLNEGHPVLLYDGLCGLCDRSVQFVLRHARDDRMRFATLQGDIGRFFVERNPELRGVDSVILVTGEAAYVRSTAVLEVLRWVGGPWSLLLVGYAIPRWLRDKAYDWVARKRYGWFGRYDSCPLPSPEQRQRFLD